MLCGADRAYELHSEGSPLSVYARDQCRCDIEAQGIKQATYEDDCRRAANRLVSEALSHVGIPGRYKLATFETATIDRRNRSVVEAARAWSASALYQDRGLYYFGPPGTGKTHIACCILHEVITSGQLLLRADWPSAWRTMSAVYVGVPEWLERCRESYNSSAAAREAASAETSAILVLDDIGVENPTEWVRERLYTLIDYRYSHRRATILTSNCTLGELAGRLTPRIASRLAEMCTQVPIGGADRRISK